MAALTTNVKIWAWGAGILGIVLVICGFLVQGEERKKGSKEKNNPLMWVSIVTGFFMVLAGFMTLMKLGKKAGGMKGMEMGPAKTEASISPEPSPDLGMPGMPSMPM